MKRSAAWLAATVILAGCGGRATWSPVTHSRGPGDRLELRVVERASMDDFAYTLNRALGRRGHAYDCMLEVVLWLPTSPSSIHIVAPGIELGASPICGPRAARTIAKLARAHHVMDAYLTRVYWSDRPIVDGERPLPDSIEISEGIQRALDAHDPAMTFIVEARPNHSVADTFKIATTFARLGARVLVYDNGHDDEPGDEPDDE